MIDSIAVGTGGVGKSDWYMPYFTAKRDPSLLSYIDLAAGSDDLSPRKKLAKTFLRPKTWKQFCEEISVDNCTSSYYDEEGRLISARPPTADDDDNISQEADRYFIDGAFHGHFAPTKENDCEKFSGNCTGHFINPPCDWSTFAASQAYHLNISCKSNGPGIAGGYCKYYCMYNIYYII